MCLNNVCNVPSSMAIFIVAAPPHLNKSLLPALKALSVWEHPLATRPDRQKQIKT